MTGFNPVENNFSEMYAQPPSRRDAGAGDMSPNTQQQIHS